MSDEDQLQWEARTSRPAALAAFGAGLLLLAGTVVLLSIPEDRAGVQQTGDFLLSVNDSPGSLLAATALQGVAALCLIFVFYYLFRAIIHRAPTIPRWFVYLIFVTPVLYAIAQVLAATSQIDAAELFAEGRPIRGDAGDERADDILQDNVNEAAFGFSVAGTVGTAFLFVMLPLRAWRAGLLSPFMGVLGIIAGVLFVLPIFPGLPVVIQAFWLAALGALILGRWPGGRGPAWETGRAEPWPAPARRRGLEPGPEERAPEADTPPAEPEAAPQRPSSRKRKRKR